jgi:serine/threonine protein kinase
MPATEPPSIPDYALLRRIGGGSYGDVWLARSATGAWRALKIVWRHTFEDDRPFQREFEGIQHFERLSREHPSQIALFHVGRGEGYFYYVMELADQAFVAADVRRLTSQTPEVRNPKTEMKSEPPDVGCYTPHTLRADLEHGRLPAQRVLEIGLALTEALAHLHTNGLVHRDVKPSNVIFVNGRPKLADIGLVTDAGDTRSIVGTEGYLAPEGPGTPQADLFALGKVLYEAATGLDRRQLPQLPPDLRDWPDAKLVFELNEILLKACAVDPRQRYQSADEMKADLTLLHAGKSVLQRHVLERRRARSKKAAVAGTMVSVFVFAFLIAKNEFTHRSTEIKGSVTTFENSGTKNREAYNAYSMGRFYWEKRTGEGLSNAILRFEEAIRLDTDFARAYAGLADSYDLLDGYGGVRPEEIRHKARAAVSRAVELDPKLAEVQTSLAKYKFEQEWDWAGAEEAYRTALKIDPDYALAHFWYGNHLAAMNRPDDAVREIRRAVELQSTSLIFNAILGLNLLYARDYEGALKQLQETVRMDGSFVEAREDIGYTYFLLGRPEEAIVEWEKYHALLSESPENLVTRRAAFENGGMQAYWRKGKEHLEEKFAGKPLPALGMARFCTLLGETDEAFVWLNQACDERRHYLKYINVDPTFDSLRSDPRFLELLKRMGLEKPAGQHR